MFIGLIALNGREPPAILVAIATGTCGILAGIPINPKPSRRDDDSK